MDSPTFPLRIPLQGETLQGKESPTMKRTPIKLFLLVLVAGICGPATAQIVMNSSTEYWAAIMYPNNNIPDPFSDQQTGSYEADMVGDVNHAAFYTDFDDGGTPSLTDGYLGFRFRLAGEKNPAGYSTAALVGLDVDLDGALDIFVGVNNSGSKDQVGIWYAGDGANTSPNTTSIDSHNPYWTAKTASTNYDWSALSTAIDPDALTLDVNSDNNTDYFLSFSVPLSVMVGALDAVNISNITENSAMSYVTLTSVQGNAFNQDLGGVDGGNNSEQTWEVLGGVSNVTSPNGTIPEPATLSMLGIAVTAGYLLRKRLFLYSRI